LEQIEPLFRQQKRPDSRNGALAMLSKAEKGSLAHRKKELQ
jgi:hypothetical protein